tara:strand:+ start:513 stop:1433 length:921 start_codon:yes stop_codon:yes gene_type:complete
MKSSTWLPVLEQLATGELISGSQLGAHLSVSRAAVWQRVEYLKSIGVKIQASDIGYQLTHPVYLPDPSKIQDLLTIQVDLMPEVCSTNTLVLESRTERCLISLYQNQGRGRRGKRWIATPGHALTFSIGVWIDRGVQDLAGLSIDVGVAICQALNGLGVKARLKWPNDLWVDERKLAGLLTELQGDQDQTFVVIGIGLNLWPTLGIDASTISIIEASNRIWSDQDTVYLINALCSAIKDYPSQIPADRINRYNEVSFLNGRDIRVTSGMGQISGIAHGIDEFGRLCILNHGWAEYVSAGDVSVRPQ